MSSEHSAAYKIFHYKYNFSIPGIHFYTQEYLDFVGLTSTGDKAMDKEIMNNHIPTRGTIMEIAQHFSDDHPVKLENTRDAVTMYETVRDHLSEWRQALGQESNVSDAPVEQLRILDEFATSIFEIARRFKPEVIRRNSISTRLQSIGSNNGQVLRKGLPPVVDKNAPIKVKPLAVHHPVIDTIDEYYNRRNPSQ
jgi:hypothetical protein